jgi:hypothetical protein
MRTTINVDDDVMLAVKERARRENRTAGEILSELARAALTGRVGGQQVPSEEFYGFRPLPHRGPAVSNALIDELRDEDAV